MDIHAPATATERLPGRPFLSPANALLLAIWLGLCAGYLDVGVVVAKKLTLNKEGSYRSARDFPWAVPVGHVVLALGPATLLAAVGWRRGRGSGRGVSLRAGAWLLATLALGAALLRMPAHSASSLILAAGLGKLFSSAVGAYGFGPRVGWVRKSLAGMVGLLILLFGLMLRESRAVARLPRPPSARNVVFLVWDTVRRGNLSLYGYPRQTTPNLSRWAAKGVRFDLSLAPSPWTYPSHACFFTGQWPFQTNSQWKFALDTPDPTLAEFLAARGYQTAGFVANTNCCTYETGLDRGFIHFEDYPLTPRSLLSRTVPGKWLLEHFLIIVNPFQRKWVSVQSRGAGGVNEAFLRWLGQRRADRPFFAFLNYFDAHEPYIPPPGYAGRFGTRPTSLRDEQFLFSYVGVNKLRIRQRDLDLAHDCYDDCIAFLDAQLGGLLDELQRQRILEDTVVIITSDHGEGFGEHGFFGHAYAVEIQEVGVPLVILAPGAPRGRGVTSPVSLRDLPATVTDLLGLAKDSPFPGRSLAEYWRIPAGQTAAQVASPVLSEQANETALHSPPGTTGGRGFQMSLVGPDGFQYIRTGPGGEYLYNLWRDPWARTNLIGSPDGDARLRWFRGMLLQTLTENRGSTEVEVAYLNAYRQRLADLVRGGDVRRVATRP